MAPATALLLTGINLVGSGKSGNLQKYVVIVLTIALASIFIYGLGATVTGAVTIHAVDNFAPNGTLLVFTTAAMIFTAFHRLRANRSSRRGSSDPKRNLPRSLIGSVVLVLSLYLLVYYVSIRVMSIEELAGSRETAVVNVARALLGPAGAGAALLAGLLATVSSANASILSASRTLFALARDGAIPRPFARVSQRDFLRPGLLSCPLVFQRPLMRFTDGFYGPSIGIENQ